MNDDLKVQKLDEQINAIQVRMADPHLCEGTASVSSRISGYYRPTHNWNRGKSAEFIQRSEYTVGT
jgi:anaerobic ribonucleoside-triphosphate reductase